MRVDMNGLLKATGIERSIDFEVLDTATAARPMCDIKE